MLTTISLSPDFSKLYNKYNLIGTLKYLGLNQEKLDFVSNFENILNNNYFQDLSSDPNSNTSFKNIATIRIELLKPFLKVLTFYKLYEQMKEDYGYEKARELLESLWNGELYLHDSVHITPYCLSVDLRRIIYEGMPWGRLQSKPPKRANTFINQVKECIIELSHEFAGAIATPTLILLYTYMYLKEKGIDCEINEEEVKNDFQNFVHTINKELRNGQESAFTNLSFFDRYILNELVSYVYSDLINNLGIEKEKFIEKVYKVQEIVMEYLCEGIDGKPITFPVLTVCMIKDEKTNEIKDKEFLELVAKNNKKGQMNIYLSYHPEKWAACCRFTPQYEKLEDFKFDSFGNGGLDVGSIRVVTINLNRIALEIIKEKEEINIDEYLLKLRETIDKAILILDSFRRLLKKMINKGIYKFFNLGWFDLDKHFFSTIGFTGLYETIKTMGYDFLSKDKEIRKISINYACKILEYMDTIIQILNKTRNIKYNLEQVPGESACVSLCLIDKLYFGANLVPYNIYANQFVPLYIDHDITDKIEIEKYFYKYLSGGGITHLNIGEELNTENVKYLIELCGKYGIDHFAINPVFSLCEKGHSTLGKFDKCPKCNAKIVDYITRIVGYFTAVSKWNKTRREWEFPRRKFNSLNI